MTLSRRNRTFGAGRQTAALSTYAGVVRLVDAARLPKAPMARLADRYAIGLLAVTLALAAAAWFFSGDPKRALAVLVVATPCPQIIAVPVAIVAGISRAAKRGLLVKSARILELLPQIRTVLIDKTGTLTDGQAHARIYNATHNEFLIDLFQIVGRRLLPHTYDGHSRESIYGTRAIGILRSTHPNHEGISVSKRDRGQRSQALAFRDLPSQLFR